MAKRYHQSVRDRLSESRGEEKHLMRSDSGRGMEKAGYAMISEDHSACANLPQSSMQKLWPKPGYYAESDLDDTIRGVNRQMDEDGSDMRRHKSRSKY